MGVAVIDVEGPHGESSRSSSCTRGDGGTKGDRLGCDVQEKGLARTVLGDIGSLGSSTNLDVLASAISSISSNEGILIIGRTVSMDDRPLGRLYMMPVLAAYGFDSASNSRRRG